MAIIIECGNKPELIIKCRQLERQGMHGHFNCRHFTLPPSLAFSPVSFQTKAPANIDISEKLDEKLTGQKTRRCATAGNYFEAKKLTAPKTSLRLPVSVYVSVIEPYTLNLLPYTCNSHSSEAIFFSALLKCMPTRQISTPSARYFS